MVNIVGHHRDDHTHDHGRRFIHGASLPHASALTFGDGRDWAHQSGSHSEHYASGSVLSGVWTHCYTAATPAATPTGAPRVMPTRRRYVTVTSTVMPTVSVTPTAIARCASAATGGRRPAGLLHDILRIVGKGLRSESRCGDGATAAQRVPRDARTSSNATRVRVWRVQDNRRQGST